MPVNRECCRPRNSMIFEGSTTPLASIVMF